MAGVAPGAFDGLLFGSRAARRGAVTADPLQRGRDNRAGPGGEYRQ
jgi:hypothetical protein